MYQCTAPNLIEKPAVFGSLMDYFKTIPDQRSDQGKRFELAFLLGILFLGFLKGKTSVTACVDFALSRKRWLNQWFDLTHGIPDATTIGRASAVTSPTEVIKVVNQFMASVEGVVIEAGVSIDGKTIRAISELKTGCRHFISLFSHTTCRILDQEGVVRKENEITATPRLLARHCLHGTMVTADALLTQKKITQAVVKADADYLLVVKGNHPDLEEILVPTFTDPLTKTTTQIFHERRKTRDIKTTITMTRDLDLESLRADGWQSVSLVGRLERKGWRTTKRTKARVDETIYFITSRDNLILKQAYQFLRNHWHIENKLHWQKDITWKEDRQRTKTGNAPNILSYLRSLALQCIRQKYPSVTKAIETFTETPRAYLNLLTDLKLV